MTVTTRELRILCRREADARIRVNTAPSPLARAHARRTWWEAQRAYRTARASYTPSQ